MDIVHYAMHAWRLSMLAGRGNKDLEPISLQHLDPLRQQLYCGINLVDKSFYRNLFYYHSLD